MGRHMPVCAGRRLCGAPRRPAERHQPGRLALDRVPAHRRRDEEQREEVAEPVEEPDDVRRTRGSEDTADASLLRGVGEPGLPEDGLGPTAGAELDRQRRDREDDQTARVDQRHHDELLDTQPVPADQGDAEPRREPGERPCDRPAGTVGPVSLGVLICVRDLVRGDAHGGDAPLSGDVSRECQPLSVAVVVVAQRPRAGRMRTRWRP